MMRLLELVIGNLAWMGGNLFLAWSSVLFLALLTARWARAAQLVLVTLIPLATIARNIVHGDRHAGAVLFDAAWVGVVVWLLTSAARRRWRIAVVACVVAAIVASPNAPYVITDLHHIAQDMHTAGGGPAASLVLAAQYTAFELLGVAAWVTLIAWSRSWARARGWTKQRQRGVFVGACAVLAYGVYLGRVERFHSWHPLEHPLVFLRHLGRSLSSPGPLVFTLCIALIIGVCGALGVWLVDRPDVATRRIASAVTTTWAALALSTLVAWWQFPPARGSEAPSHAHVALVAAAALGAVVAVARVARECTRVAPSHGAPPCWRSQRACSPPSWPSVRGPSGMRSCAGCASTYPACRLYVADLPRCATCARQRD